MVSLSAAAAIIVFRSPKSKQVRKKRRDQKGAQIRETTGFERTFSAHTAQKNPEIRQVFPDFSILSGRKISRSKLLCTQKLRFLWRTRRKAQEYWICIPSIFNEVRRENILFALPYPYSARPNVRGLPFAVRRWNCQRRRPIRSGNLSASWSGRDGAACAAPWPRSDGCARGLP